MQIRRRVLAVPLTLIVIVATVALGQSPASAWSDRCPKGYKLATPIKPQYTKVYAKPKASSGHGQVILQRKGNSYCATYEHTGSAKGDPVLTRLYIYFGQDRWAGPKYAAFKDAPKSKKYASYAGPVIFSAKGELCVNAVGTMTGKGSNTGHKYKEEAVAYAYGGSNCF